MAQVRRASAATPWRTVRLTRSIKAVLSRPVRPSPRPRGFESRLCPQAHHIRDSHQLAPPGAFFHLAIDQARRYLPLAYMPPSLNHLKPLAKMGCEGIKVQIEAITGEERQTERRPGFVAGSG